MDDYDPISDATPPKRRKLNKEYDSADDSGEEFTVEDLEPSATLPLTRPQLQYPKEQFHSDLKTSSSTFNARSSSPPRTFVTQPTQALNANTQPTQPLAPNQNGNIQVERSSPIVESPPRPQPQPLKRAPFAKPSSFLAGAMGSMAPPGTALRLPPGVQSRPAPSPAPAESDEEEDPPVHYSSDEETQGISLKPTNFKKGDRGLNSTPNRSSPVVKESPKIAGFSDLMSEFKYSSPSSGWRSDDMAAAYTSRPRAPRPAVQRVPSRAAPVANKPREFQSVDEVPDPAIRIKVRQMLDLAGHETVQRCYDALVEKKGRVDDALSWLYEDEEQDAPGEDDDDMDELASTTPMVKRGVAIPAYTQSSQPIRPAAKQEVQVPIKTIAEKYGSTQAARKPSLASPDDEDVKPRRRLQQGRKTRSPTPPSSPLQKPPQPLQRLKPTAVIAIDDEDESEAEAEPDVVDEAIVENSDDRRLLHFFNTCSVQDLTDLSAQPEDVIKFVIDKRPFESLDVIRAISNVTETKSGKKSRSRPVGDKIVDICSEVFTGYDAVDELVEQCELIGKPIQDALKGWGIGSTRDGELQLTNLDDAHDSGIGTPSSSSGDIPVPSKQSKGRFLSQPESMNSEATLKDYQLVGLNWLTLLYSKKLSCILADEMGLGKTCQVISFLAHLQQQSVDGVHLVIVPGSTLENWLREFEFFAPSLRVRPYYGLQKEREALQHYILAEIDDIDVIVTTYDMAVKSDDNKFLRNYVNPHVCIYDEGHTLRNPQTDRYKQLTRIPSSFRVLLTGTPLQNNLKELVAILAFIMPGVFVEKRDELDFIFQHKASTMDEDHAALLSAQRISRARSMMTPFILRRKKAQVLDLPKKLNRLKYCDMTPAQSKYYAELIAEAQDYFAQKANGKRTGTKASAKASSNVLMSLRKAAIHPLLSRRIYDDAKIDKIVALLLKNAEFAGNTPERTREYLVGEHHQSFKGGDYGLHCFCKERPYLQKFALKKKEWMDAAKISVFQKLVSEFAANGDRVLVFSQFTTMMNILEAVLETMNIKFLRLDGSTDMQVRQTMIDQFTDDESITLFMLSTKAGGAGINLASANKVIIFDSGFNPQDDIQAENRAHRVGQTRDVEVVRLVTRGTIEEQIHALGESKIALDERVAGEAATAAEEKQVEKAGEQMVERMFLESLKKEDVDEVMKHEVTDSEAPPSEMDIKDMFKSGLESAGLKVASKQAQY
jgi:SWI/SNF-related matrix-associated actin-dependent regulator 1 of chromatin subfamily A